MTGTGVCWEYMFIGTGMKTGTGTGTTTTFNFSPPSAELPEDRDGAAPGRHTGVDVDKDSASKNGRAPTRPSARQGTIRKMASK